MNLTLELPDGTTQTHPEGVTGLEVAHGIGAGLARAAVAVELDGEQLDLCRPLPHSGQIRIITENSEDGRHIMRHSAAHVLAQAVLELFPGSTFGIGPPITDGFYYDFDIGRSFTPEDLERIETKVSEIIAADQPFEREDISRDQALEMFADHPFKQEIINSVDASEVVAGSEVSVYRNHEFVDLCRGPHLRSTGKLSAVKILRTAGAYWRGNEKNPQLQRIYGTAWENPKALADYLHRLEEAERRDHRRLGPQLDLFSFPSALGSGLVVWHPKGGMIRKLIEDHSRRLHEHYGFEFVFSPHLGKSEIWQTSGHLDYYAENMYPGMEMDGGDEYRIKPMNCPFHVLIYKNRGRSYRDLPIRMAELGSVYRYERSGVVHGLLRARGFTQDDSHTFCTPDQLQSELAMHLDFSQSLLSDYGFSDLQADLSTRPEKWVGTEELWDRAERELEAALVEAELDFQVAEGEGAFYGPKIDVHVKDAIGRRWQMSTIQVDFALPENFDLEYTSAGNKAERPVMIHSTKAGSMERFFGVLLEHCAGAFPMWLAPVQVGIIPVASRHNSYAEEVAAQLSAEGGRVEVDSHDDTVGEKIRRALVSKHPLLLVVGDQDVESGTAGVRWYGEDEERRGVPVSEIVGEVRERSLPPH